MYLRNACDLNCSCNDDVLVINMYKNSHSNVRVANTSCICDRIASRSKYGRFESAISRGAK